VKADDFKQLDDDDLKRKIAAVLEPDEKWDHEFYQDCSKVWACHKCTQAEVDYCSVPEIPEGSWADLADRLVATGVLTRNLLAAGDLLIDGGNSVDDVIMASMKWLQIFIHWPARDRCCVLLAAIEGGPA